MKEYLEEKIEIIEYELKQLNKQIEELTNNLEEKKRAVIALKTKSDTYREVLERYKKEMYEPT